MCKFCEALEDKKECAKISRSWYTDAELAKYGKWMNDYSVAIVIHSWFQKRGKQSASRTVSFRNNGKGYKLNYCPECGRKL